MKHCISEKLNFSTKLIALVLALNLFSSCKKEEDIKSDSLLIQGSWILNETKYASFINDTLVKQDIYQPILPESITFSEGAYVKRLDNKVIQTGNYYLVDRVLSFKSLNNNILVKEFSTLNSTSLVTFTEENYIMPNGKKERYLVEYFYRKN
jgi:hypothetical protein